MNFIYQACKADNINTFNVGNQFFLQSMELRARGVALGILSFFGLDDYKPVLPLFTIASGSPDWIVREFSQGFFRKIIKKSPDISRK